MSMRNQRIERQWRDVHERPLSTWERLFQRIEDMGMIQMIPGTNRWVPYQIWALHFVYFDKISK